MYNFTTYYYTSEDRTAFWIGVAIGCTIAAIIWGFVVRYVMKTKGYQNLGAWYCCGFFLGLIGLIIAVTRPDLTKQPFQNGNPYFNQPPYGQPMQQPYGQPMQQPYGQPPIGQPMQYGQPMGQPPYNSQPTPQNTIPGQMAGVRCQQCGMMNNPGSGFCSACGNKL